ncbi:hypothetical protein [Burkholderia metallica]|uniref:hypothetical protein n=1 Tax=Burkholderia metallica TaxID=488729 RepID=UPI001FC8CFC1|nr:hypothetical protein [Burkholderia metallica]
MTNLRRKLEPVPARPRHPLTEPSFGYRLVGLETVRLTEGLRDAALSGLDRLKPAPDAHGKLPFSLM